MNRFTTGRLFEPMSQSFNDEVKTESFRVLGVKKSNTWIGIRRKGGRWIYTSSETKLKFQNWHRKQPAKKGRDCVYLYNGTGKWIDLPCWVKKYFICEFV